MIEMGGMMRQRKTEGEKEEMSEKVVKMRIWGNCRVFERNAGNILVRSLWPASGESFCLAFSLVMGVLRILNQRNSSERWICRLIVVS